MCKIHKTKILGFYCVSCCTLVCPVCFSKDEEHFQHNLKEIGEAEQDMDERIKKKIKEFIDVKKDFIKSLEILNEERLFLENEFESLLQEHKMKEGEVKEIIDYISNFEKEFIINKKNRCEFFINEKQKIIKNIKSVSKIPEYKSYINNLKNEIRNNFKVEQLFNYKIDDSEKLNQDQILFYTNEDKKIYTFDFKKMEKELLYESTQNIHVIKVLSDQTFLFTTRQTLYHYDSKEKKLSQNIFKDSIRGILEIKNNIFLIYSFKYFAKYDLKNKEILYEEDGNFGNICKDNEDGFINILDHEVSLMNNKFEEYEKIKDLDLQDCIQIKNGNFFTSNYREIKIWNQDLEIIRIYRSYSCVLLEMKSGNILCENGRIISILNPDGDLLNYFEIPFYFHRVIELEDGNILITGPEGIHKISGFQ